MPLVISDPSLNAGIINQSTSIFDYPDTPSPSILNFQAVPSQPLPDRTATATGLLSPDLLLARRLTNFPESVYDLTPSSTLMHFMKALLGDSGAGQLRKRQTIARLAGAVTSSNFYDLDSFYGALFGALRGPDGSLPLNPATGVALNPYTDLASKDAWDDIASLDATFRERIIALARAITLGGTVPGLMALAEAITGVFCSVTETWALIDSQGAQGLAPETWTALQAQYATWNATAAAGYTWDQIQGVIIYGGLGINARNEVTIQPRRNYGSTVADQQQRSMDTWGILKVAEVLKPAFSLVSVNTNGPPVDVPVTLRSIWADSEYWEISPHVIPADPGNPAYKLAFLSYQRGGQPVTADEAIPEPSPPFCQGQGTQYSYTGDVTSAAGQSTQYLPDVADSNFADPDNQLDYETVMFPSGRSVTYLPSMAIMDPVKAASARTSSSVAMKAAPYTGPRVPVQTAG